MRRQPIPTAHSTGRQAGLAMQGYAPAQAFAPTTIGFGGDTPSDQYPQPVFSRVRNILDGDSLIGYVFTWQAENAAINAEVETWLALYVLDQSAAVLRRVEQTYAKSKHTLAVATTHGRLELLRVTQAVKLDPQRIYMVGVQQIGSGAWITSPGVLGASIGPSGLSVNIDTSPVLIASGFTIENDEVIPLTRLAATSTNCPGIGLATSRNRVTVSGGADSFLF